MLYTTKINMEVIVEEKMEETFSPEQQEEAKKQLIDRMVKALDLDHEIVRSYNIDVEIEEEKED